MLRASDSRFNQSVLTGEIGPMYPGLRWFTTMAFNAATRDYATTVSMVDPRHQPADRSGDEAADQGHQPPKVMSCDFVVTLDEAYGSETIRDGRVSVRPAPPESLIAWFQF